MNCERVDPVLYDHMLDLLDPALSAEVSLHLEACPGCTALGERRKNALRVLDQWQPQPPSREATAKIRRRPRIWAAAAAVAAAVGIGAWLWNAFPGSSPALRVISGNVDVENTTIRCKEGTQGVVRLPDESTVNIDPGTELQWDASNLERRIDLRKGNAVFSVAKQASIFRVATPVAEVRALGTRFEVSLVSEGSETQMRVTVHEGSVEVNNSRGSIKAARMETVQVMADREPLKLPPRALLRLGVVKDDALFSAAFSPDGTVLATGGADRQGGVRLWEVSSGRELGRLDHGSGVRALAFSPDGSMLASGGEDAAIRVWNLRTGREILEFLGHDGGILSLSFSPDAAMLASSADRDSTIRVWNLNRKRPVVRIQGLRNGGHRVQFTPDGKRLCTADPDGRVRFWDALTGDSLHGTKVHSGPVLCATFSRDGSLAITGGDDRKIQVIDSNNGNPLKTLGRHEAGVLAMRLLPNGNILATADRKGNMRLWDLETGRELSRTRYLFEEDMISQFSSDGSYLVAIGKSGAIRLFHTETGKELIWPGWGHDRPIRELAFSPDGRTLASLGRGGPILVWDLASGLTTQRLEYARSETTSFAWMPDGREILSGSEDGSVRIVKVQTNKERLILFAGGPVQCVAVSRTGTLIAAGTEAGIRIWNGSTGKELWFLEPGRVKAVAFSPDDRSLALATGEWVLLWSLETNSEISRWSAVESGHVGPSEVSFSSSGHQVAAASPQGPAAVWESATGKSVFRHRRRRCAVFGEGPLLASARHEGGIAITHLMTGRDVTVLEGHESPISRLAFGPAGRVLASSHEDTTIYLWKVNLEP